MRGIIACEFSGIVREAFAALGFDMWSADLIPSEIPGQHILIDNDMHLKDVVYDGRWDFMIAHPPCVRLNNAGWWYVKRHQLFEEVRQAAVFFNMLLNAPIAHKGLENSVQSPLARTYIRRQDQVIQPYNFGADASKQTCLWLVGLPPLQKTVYIEPRIVGGKKRWGNQTDGGWNKYGPSEDRWKDRSRTFPGIAAAMADQWGNFMLTTKNSSNGKTVYQS